MGLNYVKRVYYRSLQTWHALRPSDLQCVLWHELLHMSANFRVLISENLMTEISCHVFFFRLGSTPNPEWPQVSGDPSCSHIYIYIYIYMHEHVSIHICLREHTLSQYTLSPTHIFVYI